MRLLIAPALALITLTLALWVSPAPAEAIPHEQYTVPMGMYNRPQPDQPLPGSYLGFKTGQDFVAWMGCNATVVYWNVPDVNAVYRQYSNQIIIFRGLTELLTTEEMAVVLAHETGHCLQKHRSYRPLYSNREAEYDAEAHAHKILRMLGHDADALILSMRLKFAILARLDPNWLSPTHGSAYSIAQWARDHDGLGKETLLALTPGGNPQGYRAMLNPRWLPQSKPPYRNLLHFGFGQ